MTRMMVDPDGNEWPAESELEVETLRGRGYRLVDSPASPPAVREQPAVEPARRAPTEPA